MDLLTKTGPISGAVWAGGMERLQLQADCNEGSVSAVPPWRTERVDQLTRHVI